MDRDKIKEFVRQAHPKRKILDDEVAEPYTTASSDDRDVHVRNLKLSNWKKFGDAPGRSAQQSEAAGSADYPSADPREKFRPRNLTGGTTSSSRTPAPARRSGGGGDSPQGPYQPSGKIALERLDLVPEGAAGDNSQDSLDILVDEEHGIIGESDSGPEKTKR